MTPRQMRIVAVAVAALSALNLALALVHGTHRQIAVVALFTAATVIVAAVTWMTATDQELRDRLQKRWDE